jgi:DNA-binding MurR/RpiR family transcriptional regulator
MSESFRDRIAARYAGLSPQLRRAADFVAANGQEVATRSLRQIAAAAGVPPPTLSRLARALGFASYEALRELARGELSRRRVSFAARARALQEGHGPGSLVARQAGAAVANIEALVNEIDPARLDRAVRRLGRARRVWLAGDMSSGAFVDYLGYMARMALPGWTVIGPEGGALVPALADCGPEDVVLALSIQPAARRTVEAARLARERGAQVIAITDGPGNPVAGLADLGFTVATESPHFFTSYAAALVLIETLVTMVVREAGAAAGARIADIEAAHHKLGHYWSE